MGGSGLKNLKNAWVSAGTPGGGGLHLKEVGISFDEISGFFSRLKFYLGFSSWSLSLLFLMNQRIGRLYQFKKKGSGNFNATFEKSSPANS